MVLPTKTSLSGSGVTPCTETRKRGTLFENENENESVAAEARDEGTVDAGPQAGCAISDGGGWGCDGICSGARLPSGAVD
jgi:hypothetical protein